MLQAGGAVKQFNTPEMVLIDLDGTLVDSVPDLAYSIDQAMLQLGLPERGLDSVRLWVGNGIERLVKRALVNDLEGEPEEVQFAAALKLFKAYYKAHNAERSRVYDGVIEGLNYLRSRGYRLACVTNKSSEFVHPLLAHLGLADYFETAVCGDDTAQIKPHPMQLLTVAERMQLNPEQGLMIGDSVSDIRAARAAGMPIICMSYGYNHGEDIRSHAPDAVIDSMAELNTLI